MRYSNLFGKTIRQAPKDAESISHKLLARGGFIDRLSAGIYSLLPLGWRVHKKIEGIIREEMDKIGGQEVFLPTLQPKELWMETDRWDHMEPPLFKLKDRHEKDLALGSTHEEVITDLVRARISSYKDLPLYLYQIQTKFRNEMRSTGGLLRVREFVMKDLYSFHTDRKDLAKYFKKVKEAYHKIFKRCSLEALASEASGGTIGGLLTFEFQVPAEVGEDKILYCQGCHWAQNKEITRFKSGDRCPKCVRELLESNAIEVGHVFNLGTDYSEKMGAYFVDRDGAKKPIWMGCYGIGLGRVMAAIVEVHHDRAGIIWPKEVAPYQVHLIGLDLNLKNVSRYAEEVYERLGKKGIEVLYDNRDDASAGVKFADCDLIGIPVRLVVSEKTGDKVEWKERDEKESLVLDLAQALRRFST